MKILALCILLWLATAVNAIPLNEAFNGTWPPSGWTSFQSGNGAQIWTRSPTQQAPWGFSAYSRKETLPSGLASRRWLVSPPLFPQNADSVLRFFTRTQIPALPADTTDDSLYVKLSYGGTAAGSFTETLLALKPGVGGAFGQTFVEYRLNLTPYANRVIRVAFHSVDFDFADHNVYIDSVGGPQIPTIPGQPIAISPQNNSFDAPVSSQLVWQNGSWTSDVDLYLSDNINDVSSLSPSALLYSGPVVSTFTPPLSFLGGITYFWRVIDRNALGQATGTTWSFTTDIGPLVGNYVVGPEGQFATLSLAVSALSASGISGPTTIAISPGIYSERLELPAIPGASDTSPLLITKVDSASSVIFEYGAVGDSGVVIFNQARNIIVDGLELRVNSASLNNAILVSSSSHSVTIRNCVIRGFGAANASGNGIFVNGSDIANIVISGVDISNVADGIECISADAQAVIRIEHCVIDSVKRGIVATRMSRTYIHANNISVDAGSVEDVAGIQINTTLPGDSIVISGNHIHNLITTGPFARGIRLQPDSATAVIDIVNNFIYGFATSGSAQCRGVSIFAGQVRLISNSILMPEVSASGSVHGLYVWSAPAGSSVQLYNNIFSNRESSAQSYNLFFLSPLVPIESDYNLFYGTGSNYKLARRVTDAQNLAAWQSLAGTDQESLEGDPHFVDFQDLHLSPTASDLAHQNGLYLPEFSRDVDDSSRRIPPDRGADEYDFLAPAADFSIVSLLNVVPQFEVGRMVEIRAVVLNRGSTSQVQVPVTLSYAGNSVETQDVTLGALEIDTLIFNWFTGEDTSQGTLAVTAALPGDLESYNDIRSQSIAVVNLPMAGIYHIGPSGDFSTISAAVGNAALRGISASIEFHIAPGAYEENVQITAIPGTSVINTIHLMRDPGEEGVVSIRSETGVATIELNGAHHVHISSLHIEAIGANPAAILLQNNADDNIFEQCELRGSSVLATTSYGVRVVSGGNDRNEIRSCSISGAYRGIRCEASSTLSDSGNKIISCTISECKTGIRVDYQSECIISACDVSAGYEGASLTCLGIHVGALQSGQTVRIEKCRVHSAHVLGHLHGIYSAAAAGSLVCENNMIYGLNSGGGSVYGLYIAGGSADIVFNSINLAELSGGGERFGIVDSSFSTVTAHNNIIRAEGSTNQAWCFARYLNVLTSDYNLIDDATGGSANFHWGRVGSTSYSTRSEWQANTGQDLNSLIGTAGFTSAKDLHIFSTAYAANGTGVSLSGSTQDFDGQTRDNPPDIGADEYDFIPATHEFAVRWTEDLQTIYRSDSSYIVSVIVSNLGSNLQSVVPITFLYNDSVEAQLLITLLPGESDTLGFVWLAPGGTLAQGELSVRSDLIGDEIPEDDLVQRIITIAGQPLVGDYTIGGPAPDFAALSDAARHLSIRGISGPVDILIHPGLYVDVISFLPIPGSGESARVVIHGLDSLSRPVFSYPTGAQLILVDGASHVELNGLELFASVDASAVVRLQSGSDHVIVRDCWMHGADSSSSYTYGVCIDNSGCDSNDVIDCTVHGAFTGIGLNGSSGASTGNRVIDCHVYNTRYGVSVLRQSAAQVSGNDIECGFATTFAAPCYGIYVGALGSGGSVTVSGNQLHRFADHSSSTSNRAVGIYSAPSGDAVAKIYNNFIYGFDDVFSLKIHGIYLSAGMNQVYHNSILIGDIPVVNEISGIYISTGSTHTLLNNIIVSRESNVTSYGIVHNTGEGLISDYNLVYGSSPVFATGRIGSTTYLTLAQWQAAAYDFNGLAVEPGFVSDSDLHIRTDSAVVDGQGLALVEVVDDIDGQLRQSPPDIGADEYSVITQADSIVGLTAIMTESGLLLQWPASAGAASYHVYASSDMSAVFSPENQIATVTSASYLVTTPLLVSRQYFLVTADTSP